MKKIIIITIALALGGLYFAGCGAGDAADETAKETVSGDDTGHHSKCPCRCDHESHKKEHHHVDGEYCPCCDAVWHEDE